MTKQSLLAEITSINRKPSVCQYKTVYSKLDAEDQIGLETAMNNPAITVSSIERALRLRGHHVVASTMRRHRTGECSCGKPN